MKPIIIRKTTKPTRHLTDHFKNFEKVQTVQQIFGNRTQNVLTNLPIEFTDTTIYMKVDYNGDLLINPHYLKTGESTHIYLDIIHELIHIKQVMNGKKLQPKTTIHRKTTRNRSIQTNSQRSQSPRP